jgi:hypothetical protein
VTVNAISAAINRVMLEARWVRFNETLSQAWAAMCQFSAKFTRPKFVISVLSFKSAAISIRIQFDVEPPVLP